MRSQTSLVYEVLAVACLGMACLGVAEVAAQQPASEGTVTSPVAEFVIDGSLQASAGEAWTASATGCDGSVGWTVEGAEGALPPGADVSLTWAERGGRWVTARCGDGREIRMLVVVGDGEPFVELVDVVNQDGAEISFAQRLAADVAYGDAPENSTLRMVLYRGSAPVTGGGRAEIIGDPSGVARVDGYSLSSGPVHHVEVILEDMHTAERHAGSGRIKVRKRKFQCLE